VTTLSIGIAVGVIGLLACGGVADDARVLTVNGQAITKATVDHWARVIERGGAFGGFRGEAARGEPRRRAVTLLVTSKWLIGEAEARGVAASKDEVDAAVRAREGEGRDFGRRLRGTGQTAADLRVELEAELDAEALRERLSDEAARVTEDGMVAFYRSNRNLFRTYERREMEVLSDPSRSALVALQRRLGTGPRFSRLAVHKTLSRAPNEGRTAQDKHVADEMFAIPLGVVSTPTLLDEVWVMFVARKTFPSVVRPFSQARREVATQLDIRRQREIAMRFDHDYLTRWLARTRCSAGFIAPGCPQLGGRLAAYEDPFSLRAHPLLSERVPAR
jgi:hypothetical protein